MSDNGRRRLGDWDTTGTACSEAEGAPGDALSHRQRTESPADMAGEAISVPQQEPEPCPRAIPEHQANGHFVWAAEQQES